MSEYAPVQPADQGCSGILFSYFDSGLCLARGINIVRSLWRTALALIAGFGVVSFVAVVSDSIRRSRHPVDTATVVAADLTALAIAIPLLTALGNWWWQGRKDAVARVPTSIQASVAADRLAEATAARWLSEAGRRRIVTPAPATVRWRWAAGDFASQRADVAVRPAPGTGPLPLPDLREPGELLGSGVVTRLHEEVYARLPHGRLVLLGEPGAGKTGAMILLLLAALASRGSVASDQRIRVPVPVWLTMGGWDPGTVTLQEWAVSTMNRDYPFLRARDYGFDVARELVRRGRVALFLDGLDEMPEGKRGQAIKCISDEAQSLRIVMTSRTEEYGHVLQSNRLDNTAVVELRPIRPAAAADYLLLGQAGPRQPQWETLADHLRENPSSVAARALDNPLTLSLVRDVYSSGDPVALTVTDLFSTVEAIRAHLIDQTLVTAYPPRARRAYGTAWLTWVSHHMGTSRDLLWWHIPAWIPRWQLMIATGSCTVLACGLWVWFWLGFNVPGGLVYALIFGCASGLVTGFMSRRDPREPRALVIRKPQWRELGRIAWVETQLVIACAIAVSGLALWVNKLGTGTTGWDFVSVLIFLLLSTPLAWLPFGFLALWSTPIAGSRSATPVGSYRSDCRASVVCGLAVGLAAGLAPALFIASYGNWHAGLVIGAALFAVGSTVGLASGQVPMVWVSELVLTFQLRRSVHFIHFMEDALARQVLRQAGSVYQFRHSTLQERLTFPAGMSVGAAIIRETVGDAGEDR